MPWYFSGFRVTFALLYGAMTYSLAQRIVEAEDRYRRSLTWKPAVATIHEHRVVMKRGGSSYVSYQFDVNGERVTGDRFRSGGIHKEEMVSNPMLLGAGTELIVYYNPADPTENAIKIQTDRPSEYIFAFGMFLTIGMVYRSLRCETILPNMFYRFLGANRRIETTGMRQQRSHNKQKMRHGTF